MRAGRKRYLIIAGGIVLLIVVAVIVTDILSDINSYKPKIETAASEATGLDISIKGRMGLSFFPLGISAKEIHVANKESEILSLESLNLRAELIPLLKKQLKVTACELVKPAISIMKDAGGKYNFETNKRMSTIGPREILSGLHELKLSKGVLVYLDKRTGKRTELKEFSMATRDLSMQGTSGGIIENVSFTGSFDCKELLQKDLTIENLKGPMKADKGVFSLKPLTMDIFGGKGEGDFTADESSADPVYTVNLTVSKLDFEKLEKFFGTRKVIGGKGDLSASLTVKEEERRKLMSSLDGTFSLRGDNLITYTIDLDKFLSAYKTTRQFHLVDIAAYFVAGPLGSAALTGYRYGNLYYQTQGGRGTITQFISRWTIKKGQAEATDCALATYHNRVALRGKLNLVRERYENVTVAILDDQGCATNTQTINGPLSSPQSGSVNPIDSLTAPIFDLYRKVERFVKEGKCDVFYNGYVQQPR
ncbi:MAG: AsmA family protein [Syntrophales bacterium]